VADRFKIQPFQDVQRLQHHRALRPGAAAIDIEVGETRVARWLEAGLERRKVFRRQQPAVLPLMAHDRGGDVAAVERVLRGAQPVQATVAGMRAFLIRHVLQAARQIGLHEGFTHARGMSVAQEYRGGRRPGADLVLLGGDDFGEERIGGEAVAGETDRRRCDLGE
jgi:hypothetical protein